METPKLSNSRIEYGVDDKAKEYLRVIETHLRNPQLTDSEREHWFGAYFEWLAFIEGKQTGWSFSELEKYFKPDF